MSSASEIAVVHGFPPSPLQRRLAALAERRGGGRASAAFRLPEEILPEHVARALAALAARHEILRTRLVRWPGMVEPLQEIAESDELTIPFEVWPAAPGTAGPDALLRTLEAGAGEAPLAAALALSFPGGAPLLLVSLPVSSADEASFELLAAEIERELAGRAADEEPMQYADFAAWHNKVVSSEEAERDAEAFLRLDLASLLAVHLPGERVVRAEDPFEPRTIEVERTPADLAAAGRLTAVSGAAAEDTLLAAWAALLWCLAGQPRVAVCARVSGRDFAELESAIGAFAHYLPVALMPEEWESLPELARRTARDLALAREKAEGFSWERVGEDLGPVWTFDPGRPHPAGRVAVVAHRLAGERYTVELAFPAGIAAPSMALRYDPARLDEAEARRLAERWLALVRAAAEQPEAPLAELPMLAAAERFELLIERNATAVEFGPERRLQRLFAAQAAATPLRPAVRCGGVTWTYGDLSAAAGRVARRLRRAGVGPEVPVAIVAERSLGLIAGLLGILEAGGCFVPVDPEHPAERVVSMLETSAARLVLGAEKLTSRFRTLPVITLEEALAEPVEGELAQPPHVEIGTENAAYVLFTSGSTGRPKGVVVAHGAIANRVLWTLGEHPLGPEDRVLQKTPITFDASIWEIFAPLFAGALLVLALPGEHQETDALARRVAAEGITVLQLVPSLLRPFLAEPALSECQTLRRMLCGGEALAADLVRRFEERFPRAEIVNLYGPTEAAIDVASYRCAPGFAREAVPIGRPIANLAIYCVSAALEAMPAGAPGELLLAGAGLARGYAGRPDLTAERFVPNPFAAEAGRPGDRAYRTGDLARWNAEGELEYLGRADRQVKIRGVRIELGEIEARLLEHPSVAQAVVVACEVRGEKTLVGYVVSRGSDLADDLRAFLAGRLPASMVPGAIVPLASFPRTLSGKLDLGALPPAREGELGTVDEARTPTEEILAGLFAEALGRERVGIDEHFFEIGGHSLSATQVISRARRALGVELRVHQLFDAPTVAGLALEVERSRGRESAAVVPPFERIPRDAAGSRLPLSFAQQRLWFFEQLRPGTAVFNIPDAVRLRGRLDVAALAGALSGVVARHESLRTVFPTARGEAVQEILPPTPQALPLVDLSALPAGVPAIELSRLLSEEAGLPLDLSRGPLLRTRLLRLAEREHVLTVTIHHIASDAWSSGIFVRELGLIYRALTRDGLRAKPAALAPLGLQYADFAAWQRRYLSGETLARELAWWHERLAGAPLLELPADRPRRALSSHRGATRPVLLPALVAEGLRGVARQEGATQFMTLFAAWLVVLKHLTGREDLVVGTDVANRNREETEGIIGFFINQLALRVSLAGNPSFGELVGRVRDVALGAYAHQDVPFDALVDTLNLDRSLASAPLFQVKLFLENATRPASPLPDLAMEPLDVDIRIAKLDLVLAFWERPEGLQGWVNYSTDLFDVPRVERWLRQLATVAGHAGLRPDARLSELEEILESLEKEEQAMEKKGLREFSVKSFRSVQPKPVTLAGTELVARGYLAPEQKLPLVITPAVPDVDLAEWSAAHTAEIQADLLTHGAILFRGFGIDTPEALERFASTLCSELFNENGEHPRESVSGNVYTPVFYPQDQRLLWHNENSFNWRWPRKIFFACAQPADQGGETPLVDSRRVYEEVPAEIRSAFEAKGVLYQRTYSEGLGLPWQTVFQTEDRAEVEREAAMTHVEVDWREGDRLRTRGARPAVIPHPETAELTWFNQGQHWHVSCLDPLTSKSMRELFADDDLPRHLLFGDGSPIPDEHMQGILDVYKRLEVVFPWQKGDVVLLDNVLVAHGRNPYAGKRKILVAMGEMTSYDDVQGER